MGRRGIHPALAEDRVPGPRADATRHPDSASDAHVSRPRGEPLQGTMRAAVRATYGPPDVVEIRHVAKPMIAGDGILVRVRAASVNRAEWYSVVGRPYIGRLDMGLLEPKQLVIGADFAGTVEAVGEEVTDFEPGDDVFGGKLGAFAEYVSVRKTIARKPANLTFEEAASLPTAGVTALQALNKGGIQAGQKVLVNGASGGVGTFAVQIAKAMGADVTAVCSTRNVPMVLSLGADRVIDYTREDFSESGETYDLVLDIAGSRPWRDCRRVLAPEATVVIVGAPGGNPLLGPLSHVIGMSLGSWRSSQRVIFFIAQFTRHDFEHLRQLCEAGKVRPVVERTYALDQIADALRYVGDGHTQGKVVVTI